MFKQMKKTLKNQKGLTLIELLAVIVILGIIAAIAVPSIGGIINKTKEDAKVAEAVQIISAAKMYVTTNPKAVEIKASELEGYLDNTKDKDYKVTVSETNGKYTFTLVNHDAYKVINKKDTDGSIADTEISSYQNAN